MLPSEQGVGEVILSEDQEQEIQDRALLVREPPDRGERVEGPPNDEGSRKVTSENGMLR
jgi:hypothetical protein